MSYLVFCTFDLKNATSADYKNAYADLEKIGLKRVIKADQGHDVVIPTTAAMGTYNGASATSVRDDVTSQVQRAFTARQFKSEIFVVIGGDWAWGAATS
ncbi:hypothetical protein [Geomonas paludis]|uniref:DUF2622 domain-containing protein n=1 Tax=Geomonas paludis TaxID=2740185 RepID=A0A6V8MWK3_9BACT|nr:hypothetical protein [Geomonas paludis]GFO63649.1 hypothetical protein GMPD_15680 [Geomonas paludis]